MTTIATVITTRPEMVIAIPLLAILAVATAIDLHQNRIPNGITLGAAVIGLSMQGALLGSSGIALGALGWAVGLLCFLPFYMGGGMAAGDVKLMAAVGAFVGPIDGFLACVATIIVGGAIGLGYVACQAGARVLSKSAGADTSSSVVEPSANVVRSSYAGYGYVNPPAGSPSGKIPYATAITVGTALVVLQPSFLSSLFTNGGWS